MPTSMIHDKNIVYTDICYDHELETTITLTSDSHLRLFTHLCQNKVVDYKLTTSRSVRATTIGFSEKLQTLFVCFSNGRLKVINWPIIASKDIQSYEVALTTLPLTTISILPLNRYVAIGADNGSIFILEPFQIVEGRDKMWLQDNGEHQAILKKREGYSFRGFCIVDNIALVKR